MPGAEDGSPFGRDPVVVPIEDTLDLHGFAPREIPAVVAAYLEAARERGLREVRLIHGKGRGVQRARVRRVLATHESVEWFGDAPAGGGGYGATRVRLADPPGRPSPDSATA